MTVAICLSGGGAKGDFELGAIRFLYDQGIRPDILCSTSVGSVNAIKLAEGEDPSNASRGLTGLEDQWASLQRNSDMYLDEAWLHDPDMDSRVRDVLTGRAQGLGISPPDPDTGRRWGDIVGPIVQSLSDLGFLVTDGAALLKSLNVLAEQARALYNLTPIHNRLRTELDRSAITAWASSGRKLRLATVALESGRLRYVTETGAMVERDGSPVMWPGPLTPACAALGNEVAGLESDILDLQNDLRHAAPNQKSEIIDQIRAAQANLRDARQRFETCVRAQPPVQLTVDLAQGVLASAAIPGVFPPAKLGLEWYVDGGVRELLPIQAAVDLGAHTIYAVSAFTFNVTMRGSFDRAKLAEILARSVEDLVLNEVALDDVRIQAPAAGEASTVFLIAPDVEIHDVTTIDPGLIQINRDYGYMRAADVLDGVEPGSRHWALATDIAVQRRDTWALENRRFGHEDPTRLADGARPPDSGLQPAIDAGKAHLQDLLTERRALSGKMPAGIDRWTGTLELHPWLGSLNDAAFVAQQVPASLPRSARAQVAVTMRNSGTTIWTAGAGYRLGSQSPQDNTIWGGNRQELPHPVDPGQQVTFSFTVPAPPGPGAIFQWRMVQDGKEWFGAATPATRIAVEEPAECADLRRQISQLKSEIADLQEELRTAPTGERADIVEQIRAAQASLREVQARSNQLGCN